MVAPAASLAVMLLLYMVDNLLNAMTNPMFMLVAGGIAGLTLESLDGDGVYHETSQAPPSDDVPPTRFL
jgi:hypothetical protein